MFREMGEKTADFVWPLPLWEEYEEEIKATFGDWSNTGRSRYGGAITAAVFLWQFIKEYPWVHIDIASRMTSIDGEFLAEGAAGASINLLTHLLEKY
jgi:leucyl aminopeptidase